MSDKPISPLRRRMIEDMTVRNFVEKTRNDYILYRDKGRPISMVYVKHETVVTGDVWRMHLLPENAGALFQLASQFNLLEMTGPEVTPENGVVTIYQHDHTQGPACVIRRRSGYDLSQLTRCKSGPMHEGLFRRNRKWTASFALGAGLGRIAPPANRRRGQWGRMELHSLLDPGPIAAVDSPK
jgi:hypothetical protein